MAGKTASAERPQCAPLMEAASADLYKRNGFRITGLAVDATAKQVSKRGEKLKLMEEIGQGAGANTNAFPLNPPPSVDDLREALTRLKDPESRIIDEFFWFWPLDGSSESDEAIQAYLRGDGEKAFDTWFANRGASGSGMVAYHNLAVINHMMAIAWTTQFMDTSPEDAVHATTHAYWSTAIRYWRRVINDDTVWDALRERIRVLDDPRLTTGLARRVRAVLPEAIATINAAFALKLTERGQTTATEIHIKYVRDVELDLNVQEEIFDRLLQPTRARFTALVSDAASNNLDGKKRFAAAQAVLAQTPNISHLLEIFFGKTAHQRTELLDEAMVACANAASLYQKETGDLEGFLAAAKKSQPYVTSKEAKERVKTNVDFGEKSLRRKAFQPFIDDLQQIVNSSQSPAQKLTAVKQAIMPRLATMVRDCGPHSDEAHDLQDEVAVALRGIGIDAHNDHDDIVTATEATTLAGSLARNPEVKKRLADDEKQLKANAETAAKQRVDIQLKSELILGAGDRVQIDRQYVRYGKIQIPISEINGVRYGIYREYQHGVIVVKGSYKIGFHSSSGTVIDIECKRPLVSFDQAQKDYETILEGVFYNVIPSLAMRVAEWVLTVGARLGRSTMNAQGITLAKHKMISQEEVMVPYAEIRYGFNNGALNVVSTRDDKIKRSFVLRETWNAAIFEQILKAIPLVRNKK